jgi:L-phenylalanine/L-methionine N-acetyltransferase
MPERKRKRGQLIIRGVEPTDLDQLAALHRMPRVVWGTMQQPFQSAEAWKKRVTANDPAQNRWLCAELDGRVVGSIALQLSQRPRARHVASIGMAVADDVQGRGIGAALLDAAIELGEKWLGVLRFELSVWPDNVPGVRLYRSRGFAVEGVLRAYALRDGVLCDALQMGRVAANLPWPRVTAEDAANRPLPALPSPRKRNPKLN